MNDISVRIQVDEFNKMNKDEKIEYLDALIDKSLEFQANKEIKQDEELTRFDTIKYLDKLPDRVQEYSTKFSVMSIRVVKECTSGDKEFKIKGYVLIDFADFNTNVKVKRIIVRPYANSDYEFSFYLYSIFNRNSKAPLIMISSELKLLEDMKKLVFSYEDTMITINNTVRIIDSLLDYKTDMENCKKNGIPNEKIYILKRDYMAFEKYRKSDKYFSFN